MGSGQGAKKFLSTPSARRATWPVSLICPVMLFLSTPSARRATSHSLHPLSCQTISIHALREEGDGGRYADDRRQRISIHALREEGDLSSLGLRCDRW